MVTRNIGKLVNTGIRAEKSATKSLKQREQKSAENTQTLREICRCAELSGWALRDVSHFFNGWLPALFYLFAGRVWRAGELGIGDVTVHTLGLLSSWRRLCDAAGCPCANGFVL